MSELFRFLRDLCCPPRCVGCGKRMPIPGKGERAPCFCRSCIGDWTKRLLAECPQCFAPYHACRCQPAVMEKAGSTALLKLADYGHEPPGSVEHLIRRMKRNPGARAFECCAKELAPILQKELGKLQEKEPISDTVIGYLPRSRRSVALYGFDQARELAKALSKATGYPYWPLLRRVKDGVPQKSLTLRQRQANLRGAFALTVSVKGSQIILVDDLVTTGAGMAEAVKLLKKNGAARVLALSVAVTPKKRKSGD